MSSQQIGEAWVTKEADGTVTVDHVDELILVAAEVLQQSNDYSDGILTLDTAASYRYRMVKRHDEHSYLFARIDSVG